MSDCDNMPAIRFDCKVMYMTSGEALSSFECDEHTSIGWIRNKVLKILTDKQKEGTLQQFDSFRLLQGERICTNNYNKVHKLFPSAFQWVDADHGTIVEPESCVLTVVILRGQL
jgi:hypothetical protein